MYPLSVRALHHATPPTWACSFLVQSATAILVVHTALLTSGQVMWFQVGCYPWQSPLTGFLDAVNRQRQRREQQLQVQSGAAMAGTR